MISDANRRHLHDRLVPAIGPEASEILMELLPPACEVRVDGAAGALF